MRLARPAFARTPVLAAALAQLVVLAVTSDRYGYHRDELYFRMLKPGWGYLDQPPLTPLLARATRALIADEAWALRIPAMLATAVSVVLIALVAREVGGDARAQSLAAWGYAFASFPLVLGHVLLTTSIDQPVWIGVLLLIVRARLHDAPRCWIWAGVLTGIGLYNKLLIVVLLASLAIGLLITGPRRVLASRPVQLGSLAAVVVGAPNIVYQLAHGLPQLEFGRQLSAHNSGDVRVSMWYFLFLILGPPLTIVVAAGLVQVWRMPDWRPIRFLAPSLAVLLVFVFVLGSQNYYEFGLVGVLFGIGCVPLSRWLGHGRRGRLVLVGVLGGINALISAAVALPLVPLADLGDTPVPGMNQAAADTVGWPRYVGQVAAAYDSLPADDRAVTVLYASNYGEAGALDRYGPSHHLPAVYSAQNQLYFQSRPAASDTIAIVVGGQSEQARTLFRTCSPRGTLDNGVGVDNEEQGERIEICRDPVGGWARVWPQLKHED